MKETIQEKIEKIISLANATVKYSDITTIEYPANDSLSKAIRNKHEADIFMAELDAAFKVAQSR